MGDGKIVDGMIFDGLWDPYSNVHMGTCGDKCAAEYKFTREPQDEYAKESFRRALAAQKEGLFDAEIEPVSVPQKKGDPLSVKLDEGPGQGRPVEVRRAQARLLQGRDDHRGQRLAHQRRRERARPGEREGGEGAQARAARRASSATAARRRRPSGSRPRRPRPSTNVDHALGLARTTRSTSTRSTRRSRVVAMVCAQALRPRPRRRSTSAAAPWRSATPSAPAGARILTTLLHAMKDRNAKRGLATLCIGGGEALAVVVER